MTKSLSPVPEGYRNITPYLVINGVPRLLDFLKSAFNAEETIRAEEPGGRVSHAAVKLGDSMLEMGDVGGTEQQPLLAGLHYYVRDVDSVYNRAVQAGAKPLYEIQNMPYGDREGGLQDPCGNSWFIATHKAGDSYRPKPLHDLNSFLSVKESAKFIVFLQNAFRAMVLASHEDPPGVIKHASICIGDSVLELGDANPKWGPRTAALHYYTPNCDGVVAQAQHAGAKLLRSVKDEFYGDRSGSLLDNWGNHWYIATHLEDLSMDEISRRASQSV